MQELPECICFDDCEPQLMVRREAALLTAQGVPLMSADRARDKYQGLGPDYKHQLRVDNERLQREKAEAEERASQLCAEGLLLRGRLEMLAAATAKAEETASLCVAARLQAEFDNEDSERSCQGWAQ